MKKAVWYLIFLVFGLVFIPAGAQNQQQKPPKQQLLQQQQQYWPVTAKRAPRPGALTPHPTVTVGDDIFLQGTYIEVGIHDAGSFGTSNSAPAGFHPWPEYNPGGPYPGPLGMVADYGMDGWDVGTLPQTGDFCMPGVPVEGWAVEWTYNGSIFNFANLGLIGYQSIPTTANSETSSGDLRSAIWEGEAINANDPNQKLRVTQTTYFNKDDMFIVIHVVMTNTGTVPLERLAYLRDVDPDQEAPYYWFYSTSNFVPYQPGVGGNPDKALIVAEGYYTGWTLGLGTVDSRAKVSAPVGLIHTSPYDILDYPVTYPPGSPNLADQDICLAFDLGTVAPSQSVSMDYTYILNPNDLEKALAFLSTDLGLTKTVDNLTPYVDDTIAFTITVVNNGLGDASGIRITDTLPSGLAYVSSEAGKGSYDPGTGYWEISGLANGESAALIIRARVTSSGSLTNTAEIRLADQIDPNAANNTASVTLTTGARPDFSDPRSNFKSVDRISVSSDQTITFTIHYKNAGGPGTGVAIADTLDALLSDIQPLDGGVLSGQTLTWPIGSVAAGGEGSVRFTAKVKSGVPVGTKIPNTASIACDRLPKVQTNTVILTKIN